MIVFLLLLLSSDMPIFLSIVDILINFVILGDFYQKETYINFSCLSLYIPREWFRHAVKEGFLLNKFFLNKRTCSGISCSAVEKHNVRVVLKTGFFTGIFRYEISKNNYFTETYKQLVRCFSGSLSKRLLLQDVSLRITQ